MNIYFDIDGVLVGRGWKPALCVGEFLKEAVEKHNCYWATTHCRGDASPAIKYLKDILLPETFPYCERIKPTQWISQKTEVIDMSSNFLWFEDRPSEYDKDILAKHNKSHGLILVDLISKPDSLKELRTLL